jgi:hypothetical protein
MNPDAVLNIPFSRFFTLEKFESIFGHLKPNTKRNYISAVIAYMRLYKDTDNKLFEELSQERDDLHSIYERIIEKGEKTYNEEALWVEFDALGKAFENKIVPFLDRLGFDASKKKSPDSKDFEQGEISKIRDSVITAMYLYPFYSQKENFGVLRNDFSGLVFLPKKGKKIDYPNDKDNYFVIRPGGSGYLCMNDYKTSGSYGQTEIILPLYLSIILKKWAGFLNLKPFDVLFPGMTRNQLTHILQRVLKRLVGKPLSSQMLRKVYISKRFGGDKKKREETAASMMHSTNMQNTVYTKKD